MSQGGHFGAELYLAQQEIGELKAELERLREQLIAERKGFTEMNQAYHALEGAARAEIKEVEEDERFHYKAASVQINAPLALIQVALKTKKDTAERILAALEDRKEACEHCGGTNIYSGPPDCPRCGAPVCCEDCCRKEFDKHIEDRQEEEFILGEASHE